MSICKSVNQIKDSPVNLLDFLYRFLMGMVCDEPFRWGVLYTGLILLFFLVVFVFILYILIWAFKALFGISPIDMRTGLISLLRKGFRALKFALVLYISTLVLNNGSDIINFFIFKR